MSDMPPLTMQELREYDEAGYRTVGSLWPGDSFTTMGKTYVVKSIQDATPRIEVRNGRRFQVARVVIKTETPSGEPYEVTKLDGSVQTYQPTVTFDFHPMLLFQCAITDEHFQAEGGASWMDEMKSAGGMW